MLDNQEESIFLSISPLFATQHELYISSPYRKKDIKNR